MPKEVIVILSDPKNHLIKTRHTWWSDITDKESTEYEWKTTNDPEKATYWISLADGSFLYLIAGNDTCIAVAESAAAAISGCRVLNVSFTGKNWKAWHKKWSKRAASPGGLR